jgi:hypothetical protein
MALTLTVLNGTRQGCSCIKPLNNDSRTYVGASKQYYKGTGFAGCATIFVIGPGLGLALYERLWHMGKRSK